MGRFATLVDTPKNREAFKATYNIPSGVSIVHCKLGDQYTKRRTRDAIISMIAFIEGGIRIPMDRVMRDFLIFFRLCPTQCSLNLF